MNKEEYIKKYGAPAYKKHEEQTKEWRRAHPALVKKYGEPLRQERRKGGRYYEKKRYCQMHGIPHEKDLIRGGHQRSYTPFKKIIAPKSQIHHEWIPETAEYGGVALVEADQHLQGFIDVIQILEGEITLFTEEAIRAGISTQ